MEPAPLLTLQLEESKAAPNAPPGGAIRDTKCSVRQVPIFRRCEILGRLKSEYSVCSRNAISVGCDILTARPLPRPVSRVAVSGQSLQGDLAETLVASKNDRGPTTYRTNQFLLPRLPVCVFPPALVSSLHCRVSSSSRGSALRNASLWVWGSPVIPAGSRRKCHQNML
jgi:hypothetical protein